MAAVAARFGGVAFDIMRLLDIALNHMRRIELALKDSVGRSAQEGDDCVAQTEARIGRQHRRQDHLELDQSDGF